MTAEVVAFRPKRGRPSRADELALEMEVRECELVEAITRMRPWLRRLDFVTHELGPAAHQCVAAITYEIDRLERQVRGPEPRRAA